MVSLVTSHGLSPRLVSGRKQTTFNRISRCCWSNLMRRAIPQPWRHAQLRPTIRPQHQPHRHQQPCPKYSLCLHRPTPPGRRLDAVPVLMLENRKLQRSQRSRRRRLRRNPNGSPLRTRHIYPSRLRAKNTLFPHTMMKKTRNASMRWKVFYRQTKLDSPNRRRNAVVGRSS